MKKWLASILALMLAVSAVPACAQSFAFTWTGENDAQYSVLLDEQGQQMTDPMEYSEIYVVDAENGWFAAHSVSDFGDRSDAFSLCYALMDASGRTLTEEKYRGLYAGYADRIICMDVDDEQYICRYGLLDGEGNTLLHAVYSNLVPDGAGGFFGTIDDASGVSTLYHLDHDGQVRRTGCTVAYYLPFTQLPLVPATDTASGLIGFLNSDVQWAIAPQFARADTFYQGMAVVSRPEAKDLCGLIDTTGNVILPFEFSWIYVDTRYIMATRDVDDRQLYEVYDPSGTFLFSYEGTVSDYGQYFCGWPTYRGGNDLMDASGKVVRSIDSKEGYFYSGSTSEKPSDVLFFCNNSDGLTYLMQDAFTPMGQGYSSLNYGLTVDGRTYCIAAQGNMIYDETYEYWYAEWSTVRYGLIDSENNVVVPIQYRTLYPLQYSDNLLVFADDSGNGVMDISGNVLFYRSNYMDLMD